MITSTVSEGLEYLYVWVIARTAWLRPLGRAMQTCEKADAANNTTARRLCMLQASVSKALPSLPQNSALTKSGNRFGGRWDLERRCWPVRAANA